MLSRLLFRHRSPQPKFAQGLFLGLIIAFVAITQVKPAVGLAGLGATAVLGAVLVELNRVRIWEGYRKTYKKRRNLSGLWSEPRKVYYTINVVILWPFVAIMGVLCIWTAYLIG